MAQAEECRFQKFSPQEYLRFSVFTVGIVSTQPLLTALLPEVWGASFLRTKVTKLLRFGLHQESTTPPLSGRFPGLITNKQGYSQPSLKERNALLGGGNSGSSYVSDHLLHGHDPACTPWPSMVLPSFLSLFSINSLKPVALDMCSATPSCTSDSL